MAASAGPEIERLIALLAKLPGMGPRSARRATLALLKRRDQLLIPLAEALADTAAKVKSCSICGTPDTRDPCAICSDPARDGRLIVGGEDEDSSTAHASIPELKRKTDRISRKLKALLPMVEFEVDHAWAGAFGESATGLPSIGPVPDMDHAFAVMGFGGNGITYSVIASQVVGAAIRGRTDPDADLYRP